MSTSHLQDDKWTSHKHRWFQLQLVEIRWCLRCHCKWIVFVLLSQRLLERQPEGRYSGSGTEQWCPRLSRPTPGCDL